MTHGVISQKRIYRSVIDRVYNLSIVFDIYLTERFPFASEAYRPVFNRPTIVSARCESCFIYTRFFLNQHLSSVKSQHTSTGRCTKPLWDSCLRSLVEGRTLYQDGRGGRTCPRYLGQLHTCSEVLYVFLVRAQLARPAVSAFTAAS